MRVSFFFSFCLFFVLSIGEGGIALFVSLSKLFARSAVRKKKFVSRQYRYRESSL